MTIPDRITRLQLEAAFAELGLDEGEILLFGYEPTTAWLEVHLRGQADQPHVECVIAKIPIVDRAPEPADDLLGQIGEAA